MAGTKLPRSPVSTAVSRPWLVDSGGGEPWGQENTQSLLVPALTSKVREPMAQSLGLGKDILLGFGLTQKQAL